MSDNAKEIVQVATASNPAQAHIWQQALTDAGIECKVVGDYLSTGVGTYPGIPAEIWVHQADQARAEAILTEIREKQSEDEEE